MWIWLTATAKEGATPEAIQEKRQQWRAQGKDRRLAACCRSATRYVVEHQTSPQVLWLLETDDRTAVDVITEHFADLWDIRTHDVRPEAIG